jgi:hypothetical protein
MSRLIPAKDAFPGIVPVTYTQGLKLIAEKVLPGVFVGRKVFVDADKLALFIESGGQRLAGGWRREAR